jgi:tRNA threonylcarbamoyladenosine biosynthesis protein TsaB
VKLLAMETSSRTLSLAAFDGGALKAELFEAAVMRQNEALAPLVQKILASLGWKAAEINAVAVSQGPGSFAGLRSGLAFAKGLSFACGASILGVPTLEAWAEADPEAEVWLDARRGLVYRRNPGGEAEMIPLEAAKLALKPGQKVLGDVTDPESRLGAAAVGRLALLRLAKGEKDDPSLIEPIYLRRPEAEILWEKRHGV